MAFIDPPTPQHPRKLRVGVLISGRGSNLKALLDAASSSDYPAQIVLVVSNKTSAAGLTLARDAGVPTAIIAHRDFTDRQSFDRKLTEQLELANVELVCLAGFMRILSAEFVRHWQGCLINIHPSLLPAYKGLDVHQRMIDDSVSLAGCTVHYVTEEMDAGPIIGQREVFVLATDNAEKLADRILVEEHILYPDCVRMIAEKRIDFNQAQLAK